MTVKSYKLSCLAERDLENIIESTIQAWGVEQARNYALTIDHGLSKLAEVPELGRHRPELFKSALSFPIEKHIVFYRATANGIEVARILHQRMDFSQHL